jgi:hypothetical protein
VIPQPGTDRLAEIAAGVRAGVLEEALSEARRRAVTELADRLTTAIVAAVLTPTTSEPETATRSSVTPAQRDAADTDLPPGAGVYAYGVVPHDLVPPVVVGLGESKVRLIEQRDIALLVSDIDTGLLQGLEEEEITPDGRLATLAQRHHDVVNATFRAGPIVPLRFGTVLRDDTAAARMLEERYAEWRRALAKVTGAAEYTVRVTRSVDASSDRSPAAPPMAEEAGTPGTAYLRVRAEQLSRQEAQRQVDDTVARTALERLGALAADVADGPGATGSAEVIADATYLVPFERQQEFLTATDQMSREFQHQGLELRVSGPWPPYTFVRGSQTEAA